jgi:hypothetical protein
VDKTWILVVSFVSPTVLDLDVRKVDGEAHAGIYHGVGIL